MVNVSAICFVLVCVCLKISVAMPSYDEDRMDLDKEQYIRQVAEWLANQWPTELNEINSLPFCRPCFNPHRQQEPTIAVSRNPFGKRNSELINSLLSLPKNMNDAGK
ncbi:protein PDF [Ochlerotatus camptorhynchus]|uniref:protein PDF n=1 Tax=Ochlerotatus camptorhynchus TaxID=644619 RepID=UPI0031E3FDD8